MYSVRKYPYHPKEDKRESQGVEEGGGLGQGMEIFWNTISADWQSFAIYGQL